MPKPLYPIAKDDDVDAAAIQANLEEIWGADGLQHLIDASETALHSHALNTHIPALVASDTLKQSANTVRQTSNVSNYTKRKEIQIYWEGTVRVKFDMSSDSSNSVWGRVYKNSSAIGTERTLSVADGYHTYSQDFTVAKNDLIQLYDKTGSGDGSIVSVQNFRLYYDYGNLTETVVKTD
ncbi:MAG: hypothetical protein NTZ18_03610 [Candidatus Komeilibacteria bacterium]|nr:hypothetical protein [Candidatus Komeilibacteria bacterium]